MNLFKKVLYSLGVVLVITLFFDTAKTSPPKQSLVYLDPESYFFYPPHKTPIKRTLIPMSYEMAVASKARRYRVDGFGVDGPAVIIVLLHKIGIWPWEHLTWTDGKAIEYFEKTPPGLDDFSAIEKAVFPKNHMSEDGSWNFPDHKEMSYEVISNLCFVHALEHLKYRYPSIPLSKIIEASSEDKVSHLRLVSDFCLSQNL